eukprot:gene6193-6836_t
MRVLYDAGFAAADAAPATVPPAAQHTWDPANANVALQTETERAGARGAVETELYSAFARRASKLDHVLVRNARVRPGKGSALVRNCWLRPAKCEVVMK